MPRTAAPALLQSLCLLVALLVLSTAAPGQRNTVRKAAPWLDLAIDGAIEWVRDPEAFIDGFQPKRSLTMKIDREQILDDAITRAKSEGKPILWYVYRIVDKMNGVQMYRAPVLDVYMQQVVFADPDVANIIKSRFVPVRLICDEKLCKRFNMRPLDYVEPMVVFLNPDGTKIHVVEKIRSFHAGWFAELMRTVLATTPGPVPADLTPQQAIEQGRFELALELLTKSSGSELRRLDETPAEGSKRPARPEFENGEQHYLRATVLRRLRRFDEAQALLTQLKVDRHVGNLAQAELGLLFTQRGLTRDAYGPLDAAFRSTCARAAEAGYWLGYGRWQEGDDAEAIRTFQTVADKAPDSAWGKKARANLMLGDDERPVGATFCGFEQVTVLPGASYTGMPRDTTWAAPAAPAEALAKRGVEFLLGMQRDHGGFTDSRYAYWPTPKLTPNAWVAITAVAASALAEWRSLDPQRIDSALARAEQYMFDSRRMRMGENEEVYADAYRLDYLRRRLRTAEPMARQGLIDKMNGVIRSAQARQAQNGFWAHEYENAFCTAVMAWSALHARSAGATVPDQMLDQAATALLSARSKNGAFVYGGSTSPDQNGSVKDSSARMPLCESTLLALGRSDAEKLQVAFDAFWSHFDRIEKVRRNDFHSDGELAGFFFFHALFHTSEVLGLLPDDKRTESRKRLLELLQRIPEFDGSYVDSHEIGRSYGTGMALLTLANLRD